MLVEFAPHGAGITAVECVRGARGAAVRGGPLLAWMPRSFHPHEFLLATASTDRTARIWDLETWALVAESACL